MTRVKNDRKKTTALPKAIITSNTPPRNSYQMKHTLLNTRGGMRGAAKSRMANHPTLLRVWEKEKT
jgi:hypothetical protein